MSMTNLALELATVIVAKLQGAGHAAYFAGGCVRDRLMGRMPADYDVGTAARPEQVAAIFPRSQMVGAAFGVVLVRERKATVEVATFRTDGQYKDGRHPEQVTFTTAEADAQRRDFTCNGLFYDPMADQLHDFVNGQADIASQILRAIGEPAHRFAEDHLRMLRAVRFAAKLDFQIEPKTLQAIQTLAQRITTVSRERVGDEMRMILEHPSHACGAALLITTQLLDFIWPAELRDAVPTISWNVLQALPQQITPALGLAAMELDLFKDARGVAVSPGKPGAIWDQCAAALRERLMLSNQETDALQWLGKQHQVLQHWTQLTKAPLKRIIADPRWPELAILFHATTGVAHDFDARIAQLEREGVAPVPYISGNDLIGIGAQPGRKFKQWLEMLYDMQLEGQLQDKEQALAKARELMNTGEPLK